MDKGEIETLYRECGFLVARRCRRWLGCSDDVQDLTQEVFMRAFKYDSYSGEGSKVGWLYRIADRACIDALKRRQRWARGVDVASELARGCLPTRASTVLSPDLGRALASCPAPVLEVAFLAYIDGLPQEQIAEHLDLSRKTVGKRLAQFKSAISQVLPEAG